VNGVVSSCSAAADLTGSSSRDGRACGFIYSAAATPVVTAVTPAALTAGETLSITGSGFVAGNASAGNASAGNASANRVWLGGAPCAVTAASNTTLQCVTADNTTAGVHEVGASCFGRIGSLIDCREVYYLYTWVDQITL
jgi:Flp pilus assembly protein TadG